MTKFKPISNILLALIVVVGTLLPSSLISSAHAETTPYLTLSSFSGNPDVSLAVSGGNYTPSETLNILVGTTISTTVGVAKDGTFGPVNVIIPVNAVQGGIVIKGIATTGSDQAMNSYYVVPFSPTITTSSTSNTPYSTLLVNGSGFAPNETVSINLDSSSTSVSADTAGSFKAASLQIPNLRSATYTVNAVGQASNAQALAYFYIGGFFPSSYPSAYYLLPEQVLSFSGSGYANSENVQVFEGKNTTPLTNFNVDTSGSFKNSGSIIIPFNYANSSRTFKLIGQISNGETDLSVNIGSYYPNVSPSSYYLMPGDTLNFSGSSYAPSETVNIFEGTSTTSSGSIVALATGDFLNSGGVVIPFDFAGTTQTFNLTGQLSNATGSTSVIIGKYYPIVSASAYYLLPGNNITFSGSSFVPGETINITQGLDSTVIATAKADSKGNIKNAGSFTIPYNWKSTARTFHIVGMQSKTQTDISVSIGQLLSLISPSSYFILPGQTFSVVGTGFVIGETVDLSIAGNTPVTAVVDSFGNAQFTGVTMPFGLKTSSVVLTGTGETSGSFTTATVNLGSYFPSVNSSSYYALPGTTLSFTGQSFAPNEDVVLMSGKINPVTISTLTTDSLGNLMPNTVTIPFGKTGTLHYTFNGKLSGTSIPVDVTLAPFNVNVSSDNYYVLPGSVINITGSGFAPNENVIVTAGSFLATSTADALGNVAKVPVTIPYGLSKNTVGVTMSGTSSLATETITITLAAFYPQISPSTYYAKQGSQVIFTGSSFVPGETVTIVMDKKTKFTTTSDSKGNITSTSITLPFGEGYVHFDVTGALSNATVSTDIGLAGFYPGLALSTYYAVGGTAITLSGSGFLAGETIKLSFGVTDLGTTIADSMGNFLFTAKVPYELAGNIPVTATGQTTNASAKTTFTQAPVYVSAQLGSYAGKPGTAINFIGSGYLPGETVNITTDRTGSTTVAGFAADSSGNFNDSSYIIPSTFAEGNLSLTINGTHSLNPISIVYYVVHP